MQTEWKEVLAVSIKQGGLVGFERCRVGFQGEKRLNIQRGNQTVTKGKLLTKKRLSKNSRISYQKLSMWEEVFRLALANGLWAVLFVALLIYQLRDSSSREEKYQQTIYKLNNHLDVVEDIREEVKNIHLKIVRGKGNE